MPTNKKQLQRLVKFVAMLKENRYPNCYSFVEELRKDFLSDMHGEFENPLLMAGRTEAPDFAGEGHESAAADPQSSHRTLANPSRRSPHLMNLSAAIRMAGL